MTQLVSVLGLGTLFGQMQTDYSAQHSEPKEIFTTVLAGMDRKVASIDGTDRLTDT